MKTLRIEELSKNFGSTEVLRKINLEIDEGNFLVLLGPSGCGKSTLLNIIAGLETINEGNVHIDDYNVSKVEPKDRNIAMVFQSYALYPSMNVRENMIFGLKQAKVSKEKITDLSDRELDAQDIKNEASREVTELIENPGEVILTKYRRNLPGAKVSDDGQVITVIKESKYVGEEDEVVEFDLRDPKSIYSLYEEIIQPSNISETKLLKQIEKQAEKQIKDIKSNTRAKAEKGLNDMLKMYKDSRK